MAYPQFSQDFHFGAATAAYQIEGGWNEDGKGASIWDSFAHKRGKIRTGETGNIACNTYHNYLGDCDLMAELSLNAYRFSIAWSRIIPAGAGDVNQKGLDYYSSLVDALMARNITPFVTLYHWDMPQALQDAYGGFAGREVVEHFADYVEVVASHLGDRVKHWITINEPWEHAALGHLLGEHAPGRHNPWVYFRVAHNQLLGHGMAAERIRAVSSDSKVGITLSYHELQPKTSSEKDRQAAYTADQFMNTFFLDAIYKGQYPLPLWDKVRRLRPEVLEEDLELISAPTDFLGLNYYSRNFVRYARRVPFLSAWIDADLHADGEFLHDGKQFTAMGWEVYPDGMYEMLMRIKNEYGNPLTFITENGAAYTDEVVDGKVHDPLRQQYLEQHFAKAAQAIAEGANCRGYFIWSLVDNFEWSLGFSKRFGIIYVNHDTQQRIVKESASWVRAMIRSQNTIQSTSA